MTNGAWIVFLLSTDSYLPGVLALAHSLRKVKSKYPLIVAVNPKLPQKTKDALREYGLQLQEVNPLIPKGKVTTIAERFVDTWTKCRIFDFTDYERVVLIDADMMVMQNMDELMDWPLEKDQIAATHGCICNLDMSDWAPDYWTKENCPFDAVPHPEALTKPRAAVPRDPPALAQLNSGLVIATPSPAITSRIEALLSSTSEADQEMISKWMFPDQDLLAEIFRGQWVALPWIYNAIKTMRYWHGSFWRDDQVKNLHYICDKPWKRRPNQVTKREEGGPRYQVQSGKYNEIMDGDIGLPAQEADAVTHGWWWEQYEDMRDELVKSGYSHLDYLDSRVAQQRGSNARGELRGT